MKLINIVYSYILEVDYLIYLQLSPCILHGTIPCTFGIHQCPLFAVVPIPQKSTNAKDIH